MVKEHPNRLAGRIKNVVIIDRTIAVSWNSLPATVEFRPRNHRPVTGCEEDATRSERAYRGKCENGDPASGRSDNQELRSLDEQWPCLQSDNNPLGRRVDVSDK